MGFCRTVGEGYILYTKVISENESALVNITFSNSKKMDKFVVPEKDHLGRVIVKWSCDPLCSKTNNTENWPDMIILPDTMTQFETMKFLPCKTVIMPNNLEIVGANQFQGNRSLKKVVLSKATKSIRYQAFENCGSFTKSPCDIVIPNGCKEICAYSFHSSTLGYLRWPESAHRISERCFRCASIRCLDLSDAIITEVNYDAFALAQIEELRLPYYPIGNSKIFFAELEKAKISKILNL